MDPTFEQRSRETPDLAHRLIDRTRPEDALAAHHAFCHPGVRYRTFEDGSGAALLVEAESPFGPVIVLRATGGEVLPRVLTWFAGPRRYLVTTWPLGERLRRLVPIAEPERNRIYWLGNPGALDIPEPKGLERAPGCSLVRREGAVAATCRTLWQNARFAELSVVTEPLWRGQGLGRAVVADLSRRLLAGGVSPVYIAGVDNAASLALVEGLRFEACEEEELAGNVGH